MGALGRVDAIWRYPVKSMQGEQVDSVFVGFGGVMGDRVYGMINGKGEKGFPWFTARDDEPFLLYKPRFKNSSPTQPQNLPAFEAIAPGIHALFPEAEAFAVSVTTPEGEIFDVDSDAFAEHMSKRFEVPIRAHLSSGKSQVDCRPVSLFSENTARQLTEEIGKPIDVRRFRPNFVVTWYDTDGTKAFFENELVGKQLSIGDKVEFTPLERDPRCKMVTLDPDTAEGTPKILKHISTQHEGYAGVYGAVLKEGMISVGDEISLVAHA